MSDTRYIKCKRCNRPLKTEEAQILGYGPICYKKQQEYKKPKKGLFEKNSNFK